MPKQQTRNAWDHAIVIGGGLAGLLAARVLADHFQRVTLIERDQLAAEPAPRKGVPQGQHVHGLLLRGQEILSRLFPDIVPALQGGGAVPLDLGRDLSWHHHGVWKAPCDSGIQVLFFTRPYLEWHIAARVRALPNVRIVSAAVERLVVDADRNRVTGLELGPQCAADIPTDANLIVDATGRGSQTPRWFAEAGCTRPDESSVKVNIMYASRLYRRPQAAPRKALFASAQAPLKKSGMVLPVEGQRWLVTLIGKHGDFPAADEAGFRAFARNLAVPDVHRAIAGAEPLTPIVTYKFPANLRRHYERLGPMPDGLIVLGDAFCSFNPIYGQGMTVSAIEAQTLAHFLQSHRQSGYGLAGLPRHFHRRIAEIVDVAWRLTTGEDFRYRETTGRRPYGTAFLHWYTERLHQKSAHDEALALAFYRVMNMIDPPSALFRPSVIARVLGIGAAVSVDYTAGDTGTATEYGAVAASSDSGGGSGSATSA